MKIGINIDVSSVISKFNISDDELGKDAFKSKIASALNFATRELRTDARDILLKRLGFPTSRTKNSQFRLERAKPGTDIEVILYVSGTPIPMSEFNNVSVSPDGIKAPFTDKAIRPSSGYKFDKTNWRQVQRKENAKAAFEKRDPLDFLSKKNASRTLINTFGGTRKKPGDKSGYKNTTRSITQFNEVFGISAATAIQTDKFEDEYDIYEDQTIQNDFEEKLLELLAK